MRRLAALAVLAVAGCGGDVEGQAGCASGIVWEGEVRLGSDARDLPGKLPPAEGGDVTVVDPGCDDTGEDPERRERGVRRLRGVPPELALADAHLLEVGTLYLGEGYLLRSPGHPLHDAFYGSPDLPVERVDRRCARPRTDHGRLADPPDETVGRFEVAGTLWQIDARTAIRAPEVAGAPRLLRGDKVTVSGRGCPGRRHVARRLTVLG